MVKKHQPEILRVKEYLRTQGWYETNSSSDSETIEKRDWWSRSRSEWGAGNDLCVALPSARTTEHADRILLVDWEFTGNRDWTDFNMAYVATLEEVIVELVSYNLLGEFTPKV